MTLADTTAAAPSVGPFYLGAALIAAAAALAGVWIGGRRETLKWRREDLLSTVADLLALAEEHVETGAPNRHQIRALVARVSLLSGNRLIAASHGIQAPMLAARQVRAKVPDALIDGWRFTIPEGAAFDRYTAAREALVAATRREIGPNSGIDFHRKRALFHMTQLFRRITRR